MHAKDTRKPPVAESRRTIARNAVSSATAPGAGIGDLTPQAVLALQDSAGNIAVSRMIERSRHQHGPGCGHAPDSARSARAAGNAAPVQRSAVHDVLRTAGSPLDGATRTDMEARLGADFSDVRIHNDGAARASAAEIGARAYTSGHHIVIGDSSIDRHTLAHELTHVIQQRQGPVAGTDNGAGLRVSDPSDRFEREAEATANRVMAAPSKAAAGVQRRISVPHPPPGTPFVQRITFPANPDDMLKQTYWEHQAGGAALTQDAKRAKGNKTQATGTPRSLNDMVSGVAARLLQRLGEMDPRAGKMKLYRSVSHQEAEAVLEWAGQSPSMRSRTEDWLMQNPEGTAGGFHTAKGAGQAQVLPLGSHLGDIKQVMHHNMHPRTLEFTLKPGAHQLLFDPEYAALAPAGDAPVAIGAAYERSEARKHPVSTGNEGTLAGHIGIKAEQKGYFSVSLGSSKKPDGSYVGNPSHLLFQLFVEEVRDVTGVRDKLADAAQHTRTNAVAESANKSKKDKKDKKGKKK